MAVASARFALAWGLRGRGRLVGEGRIALRTATRNLIHLGHGDLTHPGGPLLISRRRVCRLSDTANNRARSRQLAVALFGPLPRNRLAAFIGTASWLVSAPRGEGGVDRVEPAGEEPQRAAVHPTRSAPRATRSTRSLTFADYFDNGQHQS